MALQIALPHRKNIQNRRPWHGLAFIMEALVLLLFLIISVAVIMQVFSAARVHGVAANDLSEAVILASNEAERFAADPTPSENTQYYVLVDGVLEETNTASDNAYTVIRSVSEQASPIGTLYSAVISVEHGGKTVYMLSTRNYVTTRGGGANG